MTKRAAGPGRPRKPAGFTRPEKEGGWKDLKLRSY